MHISSVFSLYPPHPCNSYGKIPYSYGPYAYCSMDKAVAYVYHIHGELVRERGMHRYPENQSYVGSTGQTLTPNVSMTLCNWQISHQTHVLCGRTTFGTKSN